MRGLVAAFFRPLRKALVISRLPKDRLSGYKRWPFSVLFTAFRKAKDRILQRGTSARAKKGASKRCFIHCNTTRKGTQHLSLKNMTKIATEQTFFVSLHIG